MLVANKRKYKIIFVIPNLGKGGAERVCSYLLEYMERDKFDIGCIFFDASHNIYEIPSDIKSYNLTISGTTNFLKKIYRFFKRIIKIADIIKKERPHIVLSFMNSVNLAVLMAKFVFRNINCKIIISERNTPSLQMKGIKGFLIKKLMCIFYKKADHIIAVSEGVKKDLIKNFFIPEEKINIIYNPIDIVKIQKLSKEEVTECKWFNEDIPIIINVASLTKKKGQEYLLMVFKMVRDNIKCRLVIIGEGPEERKLKKIAEKLNIIDDVIFLGFQQNPFKFMAKSTVFVLSSLHEGFPNVIIEAMACGVSVVSTDCPSGPNEIIEDGINGYLVKTQDPALLYEKIVEVIENNNNIREKIIENAKKSISRFCIKKIVKEYENVCEKILVES